MSYIDSAIRKLNDVVTDLEKGKQSSLPESESPSRGPNTKRVEYNNPESSPGTLIHFNRVESLEPIDETSSEETPMLAPRGYCMVSSVYTHPTLGLVSEEGGATLLTDTKGRARYVLGCSHIPVSVDPALGTYEAKEGYRVAIRPPSRQYQPMRQSADHIFIHPYYEGMDSNYRFDLSLAVLASPLSSSHGISRYDMNLHQVKPGERLSYLGMGVKNAEGDLHNTLHKGTMEVTSRVRPHFAELKSAPDNFEKGFSGGPLFDLDNNNAWSGVIVSYTPALGEQRRLSQIVPAHFALSWADAVITWIEKNEIL